MNDGSDCRSIDSLVTFLCFTGRFLSLRLLLTVNVNGAIGNFYFRPSFPRSGPAGQPGRHAQWPPVPISLKLELPGTGVQSWVVLLSAVSGLLGSLGDRDVHATLTLAPRCALRRPAVGTDGIPAAVMNDGIGIRQRRA
jgi:hypothetical protein